MSRFLTGIPIQPMQLRSGNILEIKCPFMSRFLGAEFLKGEIWASERKESGWIVNRIHVPFLSWNPHTIAVGKNTWNQVSTRVPFLGAEFLRNIWDMERIRQNVLVHVYTCVPSSKSWGAEYLSILRSWDISTYVYVYVLRFLQEELRSI